MQISIPYYKGRPSVTLQLQAKNKQWKFFIGMIDSGADISVFPARGIPLLGLELGSLEKTKAESADGDQFDVYRTVVSAKLENKIFKLPISFSLKTDIMPLIGRAGFFETFKIEFDERAKVVTLKSYIP